MGNVWCSNLIRHGGEASVATVGALESACSCLRPASLIWALIYNLTRIDCLLHGVDHHQGERERLPTSFLSRFPSLLLFFFFFSLKQTGFYTGKSSSLHLMTWWETSASNKLAGLNNPKTAQCKSEKSAAVVYANRAGMKSQPPMRTCPIKYLLLTNQAKQ